MIEKIQLYLSGNIYIIKNNIVIKRLKIVADQGSFPMGRKVFRDGFVKVLPMTNEEKIEFL